jgi:hypothetical protein
VPPQPNLVIADSRTIEKPLICVIIDTEEEFDWTGPFSRRHTLVNAITGLPRGHAIFRRFGVRPTYLVDYPVISDPRARDLLGPWLEAGECLVGAQLHPWVTPPFEEVVCPFNSYPCNLEPALEARKLGALTDRIRDSLGIDPQIYKAGRYGLDTGREKTLRALGYTVDTSVVPFHSYAGFAGGPDFFGYPDQPFWIGADRGFLYLPVTQSLVGALRGLAHTGVDRLAFGHMATRLHLPGILAHLRLLERIRLTPEGFSLADMCRLTRAMIGAGRRVFALSLHSPSMVPGGAPYVRSTTELEQLFGRIEQFLEFFHREFDGQPTDPLALKTRLVEGIPSRAVCRPEAAVDPAAASHKSLPHREQAGS